MQPAAGVVSAAGSDPDEIGSPRLAVWMSDAVATAVIRRSARQKPFPHRPTIIKSRVVHVSRRTSILLLVIALSHHDLPRDSRKWLHVVSSQRIRHLQRDVINPGQIVRRCEWKSFVTVWLSGHEVLPWLVCRVVFSDFPIEVECLAQRQLLVFADDIEK